MSEQYDQTKRCPSCGETKPLTEFYVRKSGRPQSNCKKCLGLQSAAWGKANKEKRTEAKRKWREKNADYSLNKHLLDRYGITLAEREAMRVAQDGRCLICKQEKPLVIDHCHNTGRVRGLLCQNCNALLGMAGESAEVLVAAIHYLERQQLYAANG